jgi:hypothetical protein
VDFFLLIHLIRTVHKIQNVAIWRKVKICIDSFRLKE